MMTRRKFLLGSSTAVAVLGVGVARARRGIASNLRVTHHELPFAVNRRIRVAHLTDFHAGLGTPRKIFTDVVEQVRANQPDLVVLTGDYVNHSLTRLDRLASVLEGIPHPMVATLGNHDYWSGEQEVTEVLECAGVRVLRNESTTVRGLQIVGVDDGRTNRDDVEQAFSGVTRPEQALVLTHYPPTAEAIVERGGRLVLAGHTHGTFADVAGLSTFVRRFEEARYLHGFYELGEGRLYVNAGLGSTVRGSREGSRSRPELAIFDLVPTPSA